MGEVLEDDKEGLVRKADVPSDTSAPNRLATTQSCDPKLTAREAGKCSLPIGPGVIDEHFDNFAKYLYIGGFIANYIFLDCEISKCVCVCVCNHFAKRPQVLILPAVKTLSTILLSKSTLYRH